MFQSPPVLEAPSRRLFVASGASASFLNCGIGWAGTPNPFAPAKLIAHRGVFSESAPENSRLALEEARRRGYTMVEIDLRSTRDRHIAIHHDLSLKRLFGLDRPLSDLNWDELRRLRTRSGHQALLDFEEAAALARGRFGLWLDIKDARPEATFLARIDSIIRQNELSSSVIVGINPSATPYFRGKVQTAENIDSLFYNEERGVARSKTVLVEGLGFALSSESVTWARRRNLEVVPFIGLSHFPGENPISAGTAVIRRLEAAGVSTFMIDSPFESAFLASQTTPSSPAKG